MDEQGMVVRLMHSTDNLKLDWTFDSLSSTPRLHLSPDLPKRRIRVRYECDASIASFQPDTPLHIDLPTGWGITELCIQADGLRSWTCLDDETFSASRASIDDYGDTTADDSFTTVCPDGRGPRGALGQSGPGSSSGRRSPMLGSSADTSKRPSLPVRSSASLMHQTLPVPDMTVEDFSFEMSDQSRETSRPSTPSLMSSGGRRGPRQSGSGLVGDSTGTSPRAQGTYEPLVARVPKSRPVEAKEFSLLFDHAPMDGSEVVIQGVLMPMRNAMLVSPSIPTETPVITLGDAPRKYSFSYYGSTAVEHVDPDGARPVLEWRDVNGQAMATPGHLALGDVSVRVSRDVWGKQNAVVEFDWPASNPRLEGSYGTGSSSGGEVILVLPSSQNRLSSVSGTDESLRVASATVAGKALHYAVASRDGADELVLGLTAGRPSRDGGKVRVVLESAASEAVLLVYPKNSSKGTLTLAMIGTAWTGKLFLRAPS